MKPIGGDVLKSVTSNSSWTFSVLGSNAFVFYDMNTGVIDAGGAISQWRDFLGNQLRDIAQTTEGRRPTLTAEGVYFNGTTFLSNANPFMLNSQNGVVVLALISGSPAVVGSSDWIFCEASSVNTNPHMILLAKDTMLGKIELDTQQIKNNSNLIVTPIGLNTSTNTVYDGTFKIITKKFDKINNQITSRINGVPGNTPQTISLSGTFTLNRYSLGALVRASSLNFADFTLKGLAVLDASLSDADLLRAEGYLCHLYNHQELLPTDHPYKNNPPS